MGKIPILYEDETILIVNKPNNVLVHNSYYARNIKEPTLLELLEDKYFPVHRLDRKTSGVILLCKQSSDVSTFQQILSESSTKKYTGIVRGFAETKGIINSPVKHPENKTYKEAETHYTLLNQVGLEIPVHPYPTSRYSLVELIPKTGRIHQLRIHMNKISHPLVGDYKYGDRFHNRMFETEFDAHNLFLHARSLEFIHPLTEEKLHIRADYPEDWKKVCKIFNWKLENY